MIGRSPVVAAAILALSMPAALAASQKEGEDVLMPEVKVTGTAPDTRHPQDANWSERPLGCVEVVTPSGTGNEVGGYFQARFGRSSVSVMPSLNDPTSANETRPELTGKEEQALPPGYMSPTPQCQ